MIYKAPKSQKESGRITVTYGLHMSEMHPGCDAWVDRDPWVWIGMAAALLFLLLHAGTRCRVPAVRLVLRLPLPQRILADHLPHRLDLAHRRPCRAQVDYCRSMLYSYTKTRKSQSNFVKAKSLIDLAIWWIVNHVFIISRKQFDVLSSGSTRNLSFSGGHRPFTLCPKNVPLCHFLYLRQILTNFHFLLAHTVDN